MKKSSKILGSVALSAALVMGTVAPAFADEVSTDAPSLAVSTATGDQGTAEGNSTGFSAVDSAKGNGASTVVTVSTYTSQISVTIPLKLPVALDTAGGKGYAPTGYYIQNNSTIPVYVQEADFKIADTAKPDWDFAAVGVIDNDATASQRTPVKIKTNGTEGADPKIGSLAMNIRNTGVSSDKILSLVGGTTDNQTGNVSKLNWEVAANNQIALGVEAGSSTLSSSIASTTPTTVASIIYTVAMNPMA